MASTPDAFRRYCEQPPPGSALAAALAYGLDPTLTFHNMFALTPAERLAQAERTIAFAAQMARRNGR